MNQPHDEQSLFVLDAGARGGFTDIPALHARIRLHAFEPEPEAFAALKKIYATHPFQALALSSAALSDKTGKAILRRTKNAGMSSLLEGLPENFDRDFSYSKGGNDWKNSLLPGDEVTVDCLRIDDYAVAEKIEMIDLLKADTQGTELLLLQGAAETIRRKKISLIKTEVLLTALYKDQCYFSDIDLFLRGMGYQLVDCRFYNQRKQSEFESGGFDVLREQVKSGPSGDAWYLLDFSKNTAPPAQVQRAAELLAAYGFYSNAAFLFEQLLGKTAEETRSLLLPFAEKNAGSRAKHFLKQLSPPAFTRWLSRLKNTRR